MMTNKFLQTSVYLFFLIEEVRNGLFFLFVIKSNDTNVKTKKSD